MYKHHSVTKKRRKVLKALATTRKILLFLAEEAKETLYYSDSSPWLPDPIHRPPPTREDKAWAEYARQKRAIAGLKQKKFIETRKLGNKIMYRLTEKGRTAALKDAVRASSKNKGGNLVIVSFDIPEQENSVRAKLRYLLKDLDFKCVQKSLWASDKDIGKTMSKLVAGLGAKKWVRIFESKEIYAK
jgi:hypothetical protein